MKKSFISIMLCVAMLLLFVSGMLATSVSAATEVDFLAMKNMGPNGDGSYTIENGVLTFNAAAAGEEFVIYPAISTTLGVAQYLDIIIKSDVKFDLCFRDAYTDKWCFGAGDFCFAFEGNQGPSEPLPAGEHYVRLDLTFAYTWNNTPYENATLDMIAIIAKAPGKIVVSELVQNDGARIEPMETTFYTSPRFKENAAWVKKGMLNADPYDWGSVRAWSTGVNGTSIKSDAVIAASGKGISVSSTAGLWPAATYDYLSPFLVDYETTALEVSCTILPDKQSKFILFYGESSNANYDSEEYVALAPELSFYDINSGHYVMKFMLKDLVSRESVDVNGKVKLNGIKIFAVGEDECIIVHEMNLLVAATPSVDDMIGKEENDVPKDDPNEMQVGDINGDGVIDIADATMLFRFVNGRISSLG